MNQKSRIHLAIIGIVVVLSVILWVSGNSSSKSGSNVSGSAIETNEQPTSNVLAAKQSVDPLEGLTAVDQVKVVHFHGTHQCWSCVQLGELALATLEDRFADELANERIIFLEINGELPENRETVQLYQARGSSLFINAIKDDQNHIREEVKIWQLINQEDRFKDYLEKEINHLLADNKLAN